MLLIFCFLIFFSFNFHAVFELPLLNFFVLIYVDGLSLSFDGHITKYCVLIQVLCINSKDIDFVSIMWVFFFFFLSTNFISTEPVQDAPNNSKQPKKQEPR